MPIRKDTEPTVKKIKDNFSIVILTLHWQAEALALQK